MTLETCAAFYAGSKHPLSQYLSDGEEDGGKEKWEYGLHRYSSDVWGFCLNTRDTLLSRSVALTGPAWRRMTLVPVFRSPAKSGISIKLESFELKFELKSTVSVTAIPDWKDYSFYDHWTFFLPQWFSNVHFVTIIGHTQSTGWALAACWSSHCSRSVSQMLWGVGEKKKRKVNQIWFIYLKASVTWALSKIRLWKFQ